MRQGMCCESRSGAYRGYGWPATLELLSPPTASSLYPLHLIKMSVCPVCHCVHEDGGKCSISRQFDDLTLWNRSLGQGEIRALNYLDRGCSWSTRPPGSALMAAR